MDQKQFDLFQETIQWVMDEHRPERSASSRRHAQGNWGYGRLAHQVVRAFNEFVGASQRFQVLCTSGCCVAGQAVILHGDRMVMSEEGVRATDVLHCGSDNLFSGTYYTELCIDDQNTLHTIGQRAREVMGLSSGEAELLFRADNSANRIQWIAQDIAEAHGYELTLV